MLHRLHNRRSEHSQANCALWIQITSQVNVVFVLSEQKPKQARGRHEQHNPNGPDGDAAYEQFAEHFSSRHSLTRLVSLISLIVPSGLKVDNKIEHKLLVKLELSANLRITIMNLLVIYLFYDITNWFN